ncbi:MAG: hypothetical protein H7196_02455 [candidate division SR1 bacterium]|nr:hypothetical protein [candidate division SR1 bacterium]
MNPIQYVKRLRIWLASILIVSLVGGFSIVTYLDPLINNLYIFAFLSTLMIFLMSFISLLGLWWFFDERRKLLSISQINQIIYQSLITSAVTICALVMNQTNQLNFTSITILFISYFLYQLWANSK